MAVSPFQVPLDRERDPDAWVGGVRRKPTWRRVRGGLDRAGFHALLRAAQLPLTELRHMGADDEMLARTGAYVEESGAILLLGRIAWDSELGELGLPWAEHYDIQTLGRRVMEEHFKC